MMKFATALIFALLPLLVRAGGEEAVVIYNSRLPESKAVADHYAQMRQVPQKQIYGLKLPLAEEISRDEFQDSLQTPLVKKLEADGLWKFGACTVPATNGMAARTGQRVVSSKIRYAVLAYGVPLKIRPENNVHESTATNLQTNLRRNEAAVDSELALLPLVKMNMPLTGPIPNWLYGTTNPASFNPTNGILMVARLDGPTPGIARGLVDKAMQAERDGLWGRAYFDARNITDAGYKIGDDWMRGAAEISREMGFETTLDNHPETFPADFPLSHIALYAGWYDADASGPFTLPRVEFMPGAFAYHLHSYSADTLRSMDKKWAGPLLAKGATCTMGCVYEPYLTGTPNVAVFISRFTAAGFTFGEAAHAAQSVLSWQITVVGDPLYRPFGKTLQNLQAELIQQKNPLQEWAYLRLANLALVHGARPQAVCTLIDNLDVTTNSAVLTEKLADLYSMLGKPSSAILTYQNALQRHPSPEQRIRLRLTLAEKLQEQNLTADAIENFRRLLAEAPDYPAKNLIEDKLKKLTQPATTNAALHL